MKTAVLAVLFALVLAGCGHGGTPGNTTSTTSTAPGPAGFDGAAALALVEAIVYEAPGDLRDRHPAAAGHDATAVWLHGQMQVDGWTVAYENFTGEDYLGLDLGAVEGWGPPACPAEDQDELPGFTFTNLVAERIPAGAERVLLLGAHWDAKEDAEGPDGRHAGQPVPAANDGASGVALLLTLMRHVSAGDVPYGLRVVLFDGEDGFEDCHPLAGSLWHARNRADEVDRMLLLDMVGDPDARFVREGRSAGSDPALLDLLWEHGRAARPEAFTDIRKSVYDDHVPFIEEGVPSVDLIDFGRQPGGFPPYWHTTEDTPDKLTAGMLGDVGGVVTATLTDPRFTADWPA